MLFDFANHRNNTINTFLGRLFDFLFSKSKNFIPLRFENICFFGVVVPSVFMPIRTITLNSKIGGWNKNINKISSNFVFWNEKYSNVRQSILNSFFYKCWSDFVVTITLLTAEFSAFVYSGFVNISLFPTSSTYLFYLASDMSAFLGTKFINVPKAFRNERFVANGANYGLDTASPLPIPDTAKGIFRATSNGAKLHFAVIVSVDSVFFFAIQAYTLFRLSFAWMKCARLGFHLARARTETSRIFPIWVNLKYLLAMLAGNINQNNHSPIIA